MVNDATETVSQEVTQEVEQKVSIEADPYADSMILQCRGFPFAIEKHEVLEFLGIEEAQIESFEAVVGTNGKPSGECFIVVDGEATREIAITKHKQNYGETGRYVDVFKSSEVYYNRRVSINAQFDREWDGILRLRGLPFGGDATETIQAFFEGFGIVEGGIHPITNKSGKMTGEAYVEFSSFSEANRALGKNNESIGDRYIEVFKSSNNELRGALLVQAKLNWHSKWADKNLKSSFGGQRQIGQKFAMGGGANGSAQAQDGGPESKIAKNEDIKVEAAPAPKKDKGPYPYIINLHGVPEGSVAGEIQKFFKPHRAIAVNVKAGGEVDVAFKTHDMALAAMDKDGSELKDVAISMTLDSEP